jgi:hypothetical protein
MCYLFIYKSVSIRTLLDSIQGTEASSVYSWFAGQIVSIIIMTHLRVKTLYTSGPACARLSPSIILSRVECLERLRSPSDTER